MVRSRHHFGRVACIIATAFVGVSCASGSDDASSSPASAEDQTTAADSDAPELLQFTNALVGGGEFDAGTLAGEPTAFWFWAPT
jgi:hypothetical protein